MDEYKKLPIRVKMLITKILLIVLLLALPSMIGFEEIASVEARLLFGWFVVMLATISLRIPHRKSYTETYGWNQNTVNKDVLHKLSVSGLDVVMLPPTLYYSFAASMLSSGSREYNVIDLIVGVGAIGFVVGLIIKFIRMRKLRNGAISLRRDEFDSKDMEIGGDGPNTYSITYRNEKTIWTRSVTKEEYERATAGDIIHVAYFEGEHRPFLYSKIHGRR